MDLERAEEEEFSMSAKDALEKYLTGDTLEDSEGDVAMMSCDQDNDDHGLVYLTGDFAGEWLHPDSLNGVTFRCIYAKVVIP